MNLKKLPENKHYPSREEVLQIFKYRCPRCRQSAFVVHELEPRSRGENSMRMKNRCVICFTCHEEFHRAGASDWKIKEVKDDVAAYLVAIGNWEEYSTWDELHNG